MAGTDLFTGAAKQAAGKKILKGGRRMLGKHRGQEVHLASGGQHLPTVHAKYRADHSAGPAFCAVQFRLIRAVAEPEH